MSRTSLSLITALLSSSAFADDRAQLSCGPYQNDRAGSPYVALDSPGYPAVDAALQKMEEGDPFENLVVLKAIGDFMQMGIVDIALPGLAAACSYEMFSANECKGNQFFPSMVERANVSGASLSFTSKPDDNKEIRVEIENPEFDSAIVTVAEGQSTTVSIWARQADGTETFHSQSANGDETAYTENSDCSGEGYTVRHNERGLLTTNEFSWSSAKGQGFIFRYEICDHQGDDAGCHQGQI